MLEKYIKTFQIFDEQECTSILDNHLQGNFYQHAWHDSATNTTSTRDYDPYNAALDQEANQKIWDKLIKVTDDYFADIDNPRHVNYLSLPRLNRYQPGQRMDPHADHITTVFDGTRKGIPILSYILMLQNNCKGGELKFHLDRDIEYDLQPGELIIWPSNFMFPHSVNEIIEGERISMVVWGW